MEINQAPHTARAIALTVLGMALLAAGGGVAAALWLFGESANNTDDDQGLGGLVYIFGGFYLALSLITVVLVLPALVGVVRGRRLGGVMCLVTALWLSVVILIFADFDSRFWVALVPVAGLAWASQVLLATQEVSA